MTWPTMTADLVMLASIVVAAVAVVFVIEWVKEERK